jgi:hypothetical protein
MKRKFFLMMAFLFILCVSYGTAQAFTTSLTPAVDPVLEGEMITLQVFVDPEGLAYDGARLHISYDPALAGFDVSTGPSFGAAFNFDGVTGDFDIDNTASVNPIIPFEFLSFSTLGPGLAFFDVVTLGIFQNEDYENLIPISAIDTGTSVQINAVPIPGAFLLLGSGLVGLFGLRRKLN